MTKLFGITDLIELNYIKWGAMLHDIGKIGMRDEILTKPGKLDSAEWLEMKIYPQIAHDILSNLDYLSQSVIKAFTKKTGHTVKLYYYDSGPDLNAVLTNGQGSQFDLLLANNAVTTMMFKDDLDTIAIALLTQGLDPFSVDQHELKSAYLLLSAQTKDLLRYGYSISYVLRQGKFSQLTLASSYSEDLKTIKTAFGQNDWKYVVPKEGTLFFVDCSTTPSSAVVKEATKAFLEFINDLVMASENAQDIGFDTTNEAALLISSDEYKNDQKIAPSAEI